ncbi:MAG: hypothetical protein LBR10_12980 [Prevotellaceae bacterium]|jgi:ferritin|nr:hypothetical protein [Prevotellaceae bacterium]
MKTETQETDKSVIEQLREIRDNISAETQNMTFAELKRYVDVQLKQSPLHPTAVWQLREGKKSKKGVMLCY